MDEEHKRISFSFNKKIKNAISKSLDGTENIQSIKSLKKQTINPKVKSLQKDHVFAIPMHQSVRDNSELKESDDQVAARELLKDAQSTSIFNENNECLQVVSLSTKNNLSESINESTIENYEAVPIEKFGLALLTGMNWKDGDAIGRKKHNKKVELKEPALRVNRMALGADKGVKQTNNQNQLTENSDIKLKIGSYGKILCGKYKRNYCQVQGYDDDPERVIIKLPLNKVTLSIVKYYVKPVTKEEYTRCSRVLNNKQYKKYFKLQGSK